MTLVRTIALSAATLGLAISPVAASANTRAGDGTATYSTAAAQPGLGRAATGEELEGESGLLLGLLALLAAAGVIVIIDGGDEQGPDGPDPADPPPNQSPGAN